TSSSPCCAAASRWGRRCGRFERARNNLSLARFGRARTLRTTLATLPEASNKLLLGSFGPGSRHRVRARSVRAGRLAQLCQQPVHVPHRPDALDASAIEADDRDAADRRPPAGGRDAAELALVRAGRGPARGDAVPVDE